MRFIEVPDHRRRPTPVPVDSDAATELFPPARAHAPPAVWVELDAEEDTLERAAFVVAPLDTRPPSPPTISARLRSLWAALRWQTSVWMSQRARWRALRHPPRKPPTF
ncbi:MAG: hypothetical protein AB8H79_21105 [Myxococcota bacterium]